MNFAYIDKHQHHWPVRVLCKVLAVRIMYGEVSRGEPLDYLWTMGCQNQSGTPRQSSLRDLRLQTTNADDLPTGDRFHRQTHHFSSCRLSNVDTAPNCVHCRQNHFQGKITLSYTPLSTVDSAPRNDFRGCSFWSPCLLWPGNAKWIDGCPQMDLSY